MTDVSSPKPRREHDAFCNCWECRSGRSGDPLPEPPSSVVSQYCAACEAEIGGPCAKCLGVEPEQPTCPHCDGFGGHNAYPSRPCPKCHKVSSTPAETPTCRTCRGTGHGPDLKPPLAPQPCVTCSGSGVEPRVEVAGILTRPISDADSWATPVVEPSPPTRWACPIHGETTKVCKAGGIWFCDATPECDELVDDASATPAETTDGSHLLNGGTYDHDATRRMAERRASATTAETTSGCRRCGMPGPESEECEECDIDLARAAKLAKIVGIIEATPNVLSSKREQEIVEAFRQVLLAKIKGGGDATK